MKKLTRYITAPFRHLNNARKWSVQVLFFSFLLIFYLISQFLSSLGNIRFLPGFVKKFFKMLSELTKKPINLVNTYQEHTINRLNLIDLAVKNMLFKKTRAIITVGGMALGIGSIVFLVSLGYGINRLVIERVARLEEMQQADVNTQPGSQVKITDQSLSQFKDIPNVKLALPQIAVVAKVNYQNSVSDMAVYGVTAEYLSQSAVKPIQGKIFESNELSVVQKAGAVAGVSVDTVIEEKDASFPFEGKQGAKVRDIEYDIDAQAWVPVRNGPSKNAEILGYTRQIEGRQQAIEVWGDVYPISSQSASRSENSEDIQDDEYGKWIKSTVFLWEKEDCADAVQDEKICVKGSYQPIITDDGKQLQQEGYFAQTSTRVYSAQLNRVTSQVLGINSDSEELLKLVEQFDLNEDVILGTTSASTDGIVEDGEWVEIASEAAQAKAPDVVQVPLDPSASKQAVVNSAMLSILGVSIEEAVGKTFEASFVVTGNLLDSEQKIESLPETYTIIGVVPESDTAFFYVPFMDLRKLGITNFSQAKVVVDNPEALAQARRQIESIGFSTTSVADTVEQIDRLFATLRSVLALLGMVALAVASLGMFNTLTVSLLERTREVGLMKAMGMKSHEVRELFLTESMTMGFFGGILGIFFGFSAGKLLSLAISSVSLIQGQGFIDVSYIPPSFIAIVFILSLCVGVFTGIYPARRATKISALNALRYE